MIQVKWAIFWGRFFLHVVNAQISLNKHISQKDRKQITFTQMGSLNSDFPLQHEFTLHFTHIWYFSR